MEQVEFDFHYSPEELLSFFGEEPFVFLLQSSLRREELGRFSFLGFAPFELFRHDGSSTLNLLRQKFYKFQRLVAKECVHRQTPFAAGLMGFLSYDLGLSLEGIARRKDADIPVPDCLFGFYDVILTIDHQRQKLVVTSTGLPETNAALRKKRARARLQEIKDYLSGFAGYVQMKRLAQRRAVAAGKIRSWKCDRSKAQYLRTVQKALEYIRQGDIYQVNLAQRFALSLERSVDAATNVLLYETLQRHSPTCFGGYFDARDFQIISSSPELFLRLRGDHVSTRPMKGTRPRGRNLHADRQQQKSLRLSVKDKAELLMITDLERNDLGRVCAAGSIQVKQMRTLEKYKTVFQATSTVEGRLRPGEDGFSLLAAAFPGGSITGCPKIRSMQIIEELERSARGIYTGAMGYINFAGDMDFNILIRTLLTEGKKIHFHVGGGIVADSKPELEYQETLVKAKAMQSALQKVFSR